MRVVDPVQGAPTLLVAVGVEDERTQRERAWAVGLDFDDLLGSNGDRVRVEVAEGSLQLELRRRARSAFAGLVAEALELRECVSAQYLLEERDARPDLP